MIFLNKLIFLCVISFVLVTSVVGIGYRTVAQADSKIFFSSCLAPRPPFLYNLFVGVTNDVVGVTNNVSYTTES